MSLRASLFLLLVLISFSSTSQINGDHRTVKSGNWNDVTIWEKYDGANWVSLTQFPKNITIGSTFTVRSGHNIIVNTSVNCYSGVLNVEVGASVVFNTLCHFTNQVNIANSNSVFNNYGTVVQSARINAWGLEVNNHKKWIFGANYAIDLGNLIFKNYDSVFFHGGGNITYTVSPMEGWIYNYNFMSLQSKQNGTTINLCLVENMPAGRMEIDSVTSLNSPYILNNGTVRMSRSWGANNITLINNRNLEFDSTKLVNGSIDNIGFLNIKNSDLKLERFYHEGSISFSGENRLFEVGTSDFFKSKKSITFPVGTKVSCYRCESDSSATFVFNDSSWMNGRGNALVSQSGVLTGIMSDTTINLGQIILNAPGFGRYLDNSGKINLNWIGFWGWPSDPVCQNRIVNRGDIVINKYGTLYNTNSEMYWVNVSLFNSGFIRGKGVLTNHCSIIKGGFEPDGRISVQTDSLIDSLTLKIKLYKLNNTYYNDTLESWGPINLGKKLVVTEMNQIPDGMYLIVSSKSNSINGTFETLELPAGYSVVYQPNKVYLLKNVNATATRNLTIPSICISPNPSNQFLNLSGLKNDKHYRYSIFDYTGSLLLKGNIQNTTTQLIKTNNLSAGTYILHLYDAKQNKHLGTKKFIVIH